MSNMGVRAMLTIFLLVAATVKAEEGGVSFWKTDFTMTCPDQGKWFKMTQPLNELKNSEHNNTVTVEYNGLSKGLYYCEYDKTDGKPGEKTKYHFYVKGKVCENCYELDAALFALVIVMDVLVTGIVMMIIYSFCKKKGSAQPAQPTKAPVRSRGQDSAYEQLNPRTRTQDTYSVVNRTG